MKDCVVYIIDDDSSVRESLADLLLSVDIKTQSFENIEAFLQMEKRENISCILLDVRMRGQSGTDFHLQMQKMGLDIPVIFITGHGDIPMSVQAIKHGAVDFLTKPFREQDILEAIYKALEQSLLKFKQSQSTAQLLKNYDSLNSGEKSVFSLLMQGLLNKQIAAELNVSEITVKVRRANIMQKMQVKTFAELIRKGVELETLKNTLNP